jgi:SPP1 gp7 family putative phage head morphogenesis protein
MKNQITSSRLNPNAGIMSWYVKELRKLVQTMTKECTKELAVIYKKLGYQTEFAQDDSVSSQTRIALSALYIKYYSKFSERSKKLIKKLLKDTNKYSNGQINTALKQMLGEKAKDFTLKGAAISPEKAEIMKALMFENVSLIKSIPDEYFKQITGAVARSIENGEGVRWLAKQLKEYGAKTDRRAELIAQDQTRKAYSSINLRNFEECGIRRFKWLHSGGSRDPRPYHKDVLDGQVFDIDNPPIIDLRTKERGFPGQLPYCRCVMQAVLDFED